MAADSSKCAFDCEEPQPADLQASVCATCVSRKDTQQQDKQLEHQLAPLQEQYNRKQQEVTLLQAQVERLSSLLEGSSGEVRGSCSLQTTSTAEQQPL
jgi:predicted  nucleic acid-binding Zn-ribbon protein